MRQSSPPAVVPQLALRRHQRHNQVGTKRIDCRSGPARPTRRVGSPVAPIQPVLALIPATIRTLSAALVTRYPTGAWLVVLGPARRLRQERPTPILPKVVILLATAVVSNPHSLSPFLWWLFFFWIASAQRSQEQTERDTPYQAQAAYHAVRRL
jgi:hypothetical protein